ncbi:extracellular solute-binding protein [Mollicutes bacterium LVI A0078]|nr:extracellular solute-binding protein [Mollicutes bacterium LVI A0075]WOO90146.1 extracellular solute-binding protein [Mollicutes bacterium LVI A0078]
MKKLISLLASFVLVLAGCGSSSDDNTLVISTWDFNVDLMEETWIQPFEEETGIDVVLDTGSTGERYSKVESNPNHGVDIMFTSQYYESKGQEAGLWADFDSSKLENYDKLYTNAQAPNGEAGGPAYTYNRLAIVYNADSVDGELSSWADIVNNDSIEKITIPNITDTHGPSLLYAIADTLGVDLFTPEGEDAVFAELEDLKSIVTKPYTSSTDVINMMQSGEAQVALVPEYYFDSIKEVVPGATWVDPTEGAVLNFNTIDITAASEKQDMAYQFIDYMLSTEVQANVAAAHLDPPVNSEVQLDTYIDGIPFESVDSFDSIDYTQVIEHMDDWQVRYNEIYA